MTPLNWYENRLQELRTQEAFCRKRKNRLGAGRLLSFLLIIILFYFFLKINIWISAFCAVTCLIVFLYYVAKDANNQQKLDRLTKLITINENELKALANDFSAFDAGEDFEEDHHPYSADLDIFGKHSLFRMVNRGNQAPSKKLLAEWLKQPAEKAIIHQRQEAVNALKDKAEWRQELSASAGAKVITTGMWQSLSGWLEKKFAINNEQLVNWIARLLPLLSLLFSLWVIFISRHYNLLLLPLLLHILVAFFIGKKVTPIFSELDYSAEAIASFGKAIGLIETETFQSQLLIQLQQKCRRQEDEASAILKNWRKILDRIDIRNNMLIGPVLNVFVFWDWWQYQSLKNWKTANHDAVHNWMDALAEIEALSSLANLAFNHPGWSFPDITDDYFVFESRDLGHPLIPEAKCVNNDIDFKGLGKLMLITGSNMAGKSTFLRTVGINIVLALAGAPVCATQMKVSQVTVYSSMRIADNLEENISTFYAELKKLEIIIKQVKKHQKIFVLLDEILRGTNSNDRHTGSKALIRQMLQEKAVGIIATHDLELSLMENNYPGQLMNYHFDVQVKGEELFFDYKLKTGVCKSMNASILMKKIGLDV